MEKKFTGVYGPDWNRCECGALLRLTLQGNFAHYHGIRGQQAHDLVMRGKAAVERRSARRC